MSIALIGALGLLTGCASTTPTTAGTNTIEGGVRIPGTSTTGSGTTTKVHVSLGDTNGAGPMSLTVSPATAPAGNVTFVVKNNGTIGHEAVVLKTDTPYDQIPVDHAGDPPAPVTTGANKVSEDNNIGETGDPDLKPGGTRTFTIKNMTAGHYVIVCNLANHYAMGMRAAFEVT
ncbi:MAG: sulfocyanin-like copper-binding protein [Acidimicrobiia bacterium]